MRKDRIRKLTGAFAAMLCAAGILAGSITLEARAYDGEYDITRGNISINNKKGTYIIRGYGSKTKNHIEIDQKDNQECTIILDNVNIDCSNGKDNPITILNGGLVTLEIRGRNILKAPKKKAGLRIQSKSNVVIRGGKGDGSDTLEAYGGEKGAGIGGQDDESVYKRDDNVSSMNAIYFTDLTVKAVGGSEAAGIGGGSDGYAKDIMFDGNAKVTAVGGYNAAGIGGGKGKPGENITVQGDAYVEATGGNLAAGIGGGSSGKGNNIMINTGIGVTATGGDKGAGIGGGDDASPENITIKRGTITAKGGTEAAGIGGGSDGWSKNININGGSVKAAGGNLAAGIGGGKGKQAENITINGDSYVTATGGSQAAGIGGGSSGKGNNIYIETTGKVTATGGNKGAGIGGGDDASPETITIKTGTVNATGGSEAAGIGGGSDGWAKNITISGGTINAFGGSQAAGIGGGKGKQAETITIDGKASVNSAGGDRAAGIGGGSGGKATNVTINTTGMVTAAGGNKGAGIGGGDDASPETITIKNGWINATGGSEAAGIGGGSDGWVHGLTIEGGTVTATGGDKGAGIGGGMNKGAKLRITGGQINATSGKDACAIGSGMSAPGLIQNMEILIFGGNIAAYKNNDSVGIGCTHFDSEGKVEIHGGEIDIYSMAKNSNKQIVDIGEVRGLYIGEGRVECHDIYGKGILNYDIEKDGRTPESKSVRMKIEGGMVRTSRIGCNYPNLSDYRVGLTVTGGNVFVEDTVNTLQPVDEKGRQVYLAKLYLPEAAGKSFAKRRISDLNPGNNIDFGRYSVYAQEDGWVYIYLPKTKDKETQQVKLAYDGNTYTYMGKVTGDNAGILRRPINEGKDISAKIDYHDNSPKHNPKIGDTAQVEVDLMNMNRYHVGEIHYQASGAAKINQSGSIVFDHSGDYKVKVQIKESDLYEAKTITLEDEPTVGKKKPQIVITKDLGKVYDGQPAVLTEADIAADAGWNKENVEYTIRYGYVSDDGSGTVWSREAPVSPGIYTVEVVSEATADYKKVRSSREFAIEKRPVTIVTGFEEVEGEEYFQARLSGCAITAADGGIPEEGYPQGKIRFLFMNENESETLLGQDVEIEYDTQGQYYYGRLLPSDAGLERGTVYKVQAVYVLEGEAVKEDDNYVYTSADPVEYEAGYERQEKLTVHMVSGGMAQSEETNAYRTVYATPDPAAHPEMDDQGNIIFEIRGGSGPGELTARALTNNGVISLDDEGLRSGTLEKRFTVGLRDSGNAVILIKKAAGMEGAAKYMPAYALLTVEIEKAEVTVTTEAASRAYGMEDPEFKFILADGNSLQKEDGMDIIGIGEDGKSLKVDGAAYYTAEPQADAGTYPTAQDSPCKVNVAAGGPVKNIHNYKVSVVPGSLAITPAELTLTGSILPKESITRTESAYLWVTALDASGNPLVSVPDGTVEFNATGPDGAEVCIGTSSFRQIGEKEGGLTAAWLKWTPEMAGTYTSITAEYLPPSAGLATYIEASGNVADSYTVEKMSQSIHFSWNEDVIEKTYGDKEPLTLTAAGYKGSGNIRYTSSDINVAEITNQGYVFIHKPGETTFTVTIEEDGTYKSASGTIGLRVHKQEGKVSILEDVSKEYDGLPVVNPDTFSVPGGEVTYTYYDSQGGELGGAPVDAGSYELRVALAEDEYHTGAEARSRFFISPAGVYLDIQIEKKGGDVCLITAYMLEDKGSAPKGKVALYVQEEEGKEQTLIEDAEFTKGADGRYSVSYEWHKSQVEGDGGYMPGGEYVLSARYTQADPDNYQSAYKGGQKWNADKENQEPLNVNVPGDITYGDEGFRIHVTGGSGDGEVTYKLGDNVEGLEDSISVDGQGNVSILNAGRSKVIVRKAGDKRYNEEEKAVIVEVRRRPLALQINDAVRQYGQENPKFACIAANDTSFAYEDTWEELATTGELLMESDAGPEDIPGDYPIVFRKNGAFSSRNYDLQEMIPGTLHIEKKELTVEAESRTIQEGDPLPDTWNYTISGFVNGDGPAMIEGEPVVTLQEAEEYKEGTYQIQIDVSPMNSDRYTFKPKEGVLSVEKKVSGEGAAGMPGTPGTGGDNGKSKAAKSGDNANVPGWLALMAGAFVIAAAALRKKKGAGLFLLAILLCAASPTEAKAAQNDWNGVSSQEWMRYIDSRKELTEINIPGTHDTATKNIFDLGAKCQNTTIGEQLYMGIRYMDLRLEYKDGSQYPEHIVLNHGGLECEDEDGEKLYLSKVLKDIYDFLENHPSETVIVQVNETNNSDQEKEKLIKEFLNTYSADTIVNPATGRPYWFKENRIPRLGEVRGRLVLLRKFAYSGDAKAGIDLTPWNSPECSNQEYCEANLNLTDDAVSRRLCLEDAYKQYSLSGKWPPVVGYIDTLNKGTYGTIDKDYEDKSNGRTPPSWGDVCIGYTSATFAGIVINPSAFATYTNEKLMGVNLENRRIGWLAMDFVHEALVRRVFSTNGRPDDSSCIKDFHVTVNPSVGGSTVVEFYSKIRPAQVRAERIGDSQDAVEARDVSQDSTEGRDQYYHYIYEFPNEAIEGRISRGESAPGNGYLIRIMTDAEHEMSVLGFETVNSAGISVPEKDSDEQPMRVLDGDDPKYIKTYFTTGYRLLVPDDEENGWFQSNDLSGKEWSLLKKVDADDAGRRYVSGGSVSTSISAADSGLTANADTLREFQMKVDNSVEQGERTAVIKQAAISDAKLDKDKKSVLFGADFSRKSTDPDDHDYHCQIRYKRNGDGAYRFRELDKPSYDTAGQCWKIMLPENLDANELKKLQIQIGTDGSKMTNYSDWLEVPIS